MIAKAVNDFLEDLLNTNKVRTRNEIFYASDEKKIEIVDMDGNRILNYINADSNSFLCDHYSLLKIVRS